MEINDYDYNVLIAIPSFPNMILPLFTGVIVDKIGIRHGLWIFNGLTVICIPGPCAVLTALVSSGFPSSQFTFEGFPPKKKKDREKLLLEISKNDKTTVLFESPHRLKKLLNELKHFCGGNREIQVSRELTKKFEEHIGDHIDEVINFFEGKLSEDSVVKI